MPTKEGDASEDLVTRVIPEAQPATSIEEVWRRVILQEEGGRLLLHHAILYLDKQGVDRGQDTVKTLRHRRRHVHRPGGDEHRAGREKRGRFEQCPRTLSMRETHRGKPQTRTRQSGNSAAPSADALGA